MDEKKKKNAEALEMQGFAFYIAFLNAPNHSSMNPKRRLINPPKVVDTLEHHPLRFRFEFLEAGKRSGHGMDQQPHRHQIYELFYFAEGGGTHEIDFLQLPIVAGTAHWVKPGQVHFLQRAAACWGFVLQFDRTFFQADIDLRWFDKLWLQANHPIGNQAVLLDEMGRREAELCMQMWQGFEPNYLTSSIDQTRLKLLLQHLERCFFAHHRVDAAYFIPDSGLFNRFQRLLHLHFYQEHRLEFYTHALACTKQALARETKRFAAKSPLVLLHDRIMLEAKSLLMFTELSNKEIAFALGFDDPAYFGRFIKKQCSATPEKLRQQLREKYQ